MAAPIMQSANYPCPNCQLPLEAKPGSWQGWLLCPRCGQPSLPPERVMSSPRQQRRPAKQEAVPAASAPGLGRPQEGSTAVTVPRAPRTDRPATSSASRLIVLTGLIVSLCLLLVGYLDRSSQSSAIFGFLTIFFFLLLLRLPRNR
jgi:hypothetical protein